MEKILSIVQIIISVFLVLAILVQEKGGGLSESIAGSAGANVFQTKRGAEKVLSNITILLFVLFAGISLALNFI